MASSSSSVQNKSYQYDVFLSFCGEDTRKTFVDHLYVALDQHGICTFKDDERLEKGKKINDELLQSIEDSRCYIIVFSKNYASSSWCLNELLKIMECHNKYEQTVFPVFYDVEPSEVRKQSGSVREALAKHTNKNESEVGKWREALKEAADLSGWDLRKTADGHEAKVIKLIVKKVSLELPLIDMNIDDNLVGMEQRIQDLDPSLDIGVNDVRMIGIKGMGGAGKTTLARAIFDKISFNFEGKSFVDNVREKAFRSGFKKLQQKILRDVLENKGINVSNDHEGIKFMKKKLRGKKVLVVLDDVDHKDQLEMLAGDPTWFESGSRIIITTRDEQVLDVYRVKWIHDVNLLSKEEAIRLFSRHAFWKDIPTQEYERHSHEVIGYASGLPLTIKVLGSNLRGKNNSEWIDTLKRLKEIPLKETLQKLELSYENLEVDHKEIFLDVACILRGWNKDHAIRMLESCGFFAKHGLRVLEQKSLIVTLKRSYGTIIDMHDHLVELGKNIVRREHRDEPHKHTRLWVKEEIKRVLVDNSGSETTRCVHLQITHDISLEGLRNMKKLRCLIVNYFRYNSRYDSVKIDIAHIYFPNSLQYLNLVFYPYWCLPKTFEANDLVALRMPHSKIKQLWEEGKVMKKLKYLDLRNSGKLTSLDLGLTPNLERLNLDGCNHLVKLKVHGGCLKSLVYLNLSRCTSLESISFIRQFESLEVLHIDDLYLEELPDCIFTGHSINSLLELYLSDNCNIEEVPSSIGNLHKLVSLDIGCCDVLKELPSSIGNLHKLVSLDLGGCDGLKSLPGSICSLQHLRTLNLNYTEIKELPEDLGQLECLENLDLTHTEVKHLPGSICMLKHLKTLLLSWCDCLENLPEDVGQLESLEILDLSNCPNLRELPNSICKLKCLKELNLIGCWRLEKLPDELGDLKRLQVLYVQETGIIQLPQSIYLLKGLKIHRSELDNDFEKRLIQGFQHLKTLDLRQCGIEEVPEALGQLECLEELNLSDTDVKHLPDSICMLKHLKKLVLQRCVLLEKLPDGVGKLECLEELNLSYTDVKHLPDSICMLKHLKKLVLQRCVLLEKLPDDIGQLESLEELELSRCYSIREIPSSTCMLKKLKVLNLYHCFCLERLPEDVGELESLEELCITRCYNLIKIPSSIRMLQHLKKLELEGCRRLEKLPDELEDYIFGILA